MHGIDGICTNTSQALFHTALGGFSFLAAQRLLLHLLIPLESLPDPWKASQAKGCKCSCILILCLLSKCCNN